MHAFRFIVAAALAAALPANADLRTELDTLAKQVEPRVIEWRRDIHRHPELGNREFRTAGIVAEHLKSLGLEVRTGVAHTGVVGLLRGGKPGPVVALRADMDALPVTEEVDLPFASKVKTTWAGQETGVMHACGHDTHVAMLMGVAEILSKKRADLRGSVKFIFQPAEESPPPGEAGGAALMIEEGALENPRPDAIFALHVGSRLNVGQIAYRPGPMMASGDVLHITVKGKQTHGAAPWAGVDPIVVASQIVLGLQTIVSRGLEITREPAIVSIGTIQGGNRFNIIPDTVEMSGTIRTFDEDMRKDIHRRIRQIAGSIAESAGATAEVMIDEAYAVTVNDPVLTERMVPTLRRVGGDANVFVANKVTGAEDFSYFQRIVPGMYFFLGITPKDQDPRKAAFNHSPRFYVDESGLLLGVRALSQLALDYMELNAK